VLSILDHASFVSNVLFINISLPSVYQHHISLSGTGVEEPAYKQCGIPSHSSQLVDLIMMRHGSLSLVGTVLSSSLQCFDTTGWCYLGDMLSVDGDADAAVEARI